MAKTPSTAKSILQEHLSQEDVGRLTANRSPKIRAEVAAKVSVEFDVGGLTAGERRLAEEIIRRFVVDTAIRVRQALSENLKDCSSLPKDLAVTLARDVESVAVPFIECSEVLTDKDLIEIVKTQSEGKQTAVAGRKKVSATVADVLVDEGHENAVVTLVGNTGAEIRERAFHKILESFPKSDKIHEHLVKREALPAHVAERLVGLVSYSLRSHLVPQRQRSEGVVNSLVMQSREQMTLDLVNESTEEAEIEQLTGRLFEQGRLTPSILLLALCHGKLTFFEWGMATAADLSIEDTRTLIHDTGPLGLKSLCEHAKLPQMLFRAYRAAHAVLKESLSEDEGFDAAALTPRMFRRIRDHYAKIQAKNLDDLLLQLNQRAGRELSAA